MGNKLKGRDLIGIGFPKNNTVNIALGIINDTTNVKRKCAC